jgi:histidinol dehydrogenase
MAAAKACGIDEIYRIGGAQAIAALAYGTQSMEPVDMICGPGNAFVAEAQRQVYGRVGIGLVAGPSEILVVADKWNDPAITAMDLLSQAEHDKNAQSILITDDSEFAASVEKHVEEHLKTLPKQGIAQQSWNDFGAVIIVDNIKGQAPDLINSLAAEHVELAVEEPEKLFDKIRHAGSVFAGRMTPEAVGDYAGGPNHVLPTERRARFQSGLNVLNFMKRTTYQQVGTEGLKEFGPATVTLARAEGLEAHALSVEMRLIMLCA